MKPLNVVITTYNRSEILCRCLQSLEDQDLDRSQFFVTLVDDGSLDNTSSLARALKSTLNYELVLITQENQGAGKARNVGVFSRKSTYTLFMGDDIFPQRDDFLSKHFDALQSSNQNTVFVGFTTWHPELARSRFRDWLENGGPQLDFRGLKDGQSTDFWHFYTGNMSLPTHLLEKEAFDAHFQGYGWEDIELGLRLTKNRKSKIRYLAAAKAWHLHPLEPSHVWQRVIAMKHGAKYFEAKHPEISILPKGWKRWLIFFATLPPIPRFLGFFRRELEWYFLLKKKWL